MSAIIITVTTVDETLETNSIKWLLKLYIKISSLFLSYFFFAYKSIVNFMPRLLYIYISLSLLHYTLDLRLISFVFNIIII